MERSKRETLIFCLGIILLGTLVQAAGMMKGDRIVFPGVFEILKAFFQLLEKGQTYAKIFVTLRHLVVAVLISSVLGISIGMAEGRSLFLRTLLRPTMILLRSIPMVIMVVIIMVLTKYERVPILATSLFLIPLISEAACQGYLNLDQSLIDVYRLEGNFSLRVASQVHIPLMAGYLKQAYISSVGMGMKLVVSTEYLVQTRNSLGKAIHTSSYFNEYQDIYAYALIMIMLVLLVGELPSLIGRFSRSAR